MEGTDGAKRALDVLDEWPEPKRLRAADFVFLGMLDDGDPASPDPAAGDIDTVMRSLEEEIARPAQPSVSTPHPEVTRRSDLGYLLEASDDDLGLPPAALPFSDGGGAVENDIWGLADVFPTCEEAVASGVPEEDVSIAGGAGCGELFDLGDVEAYWPSDLLDRSWQHDSLSAI